MKNKYSQFFLGMILYLFNSKVMKNVFSFEKKQKISITELALGQIYQ